MSLFIDILILAIAGFSVYNGVKRGFFKSAMHLLSIVLAIIITAALVNPVSVWIGETMINDKVSASAEEEIRELLPEDGTDSRLTELYNSTPKEILTVADHFFYEREQMKDYIAEEIIGIEDETAIPKLADEISKPAANVVSKIIAAGVVFVFSLVFLKIATLIVDKFLKLPVLKALNKVLGLVFGIVSGFICCWFLANLVIGLVEPLSALNVSFFNDALIDNSVILSFFKNSGLSDIF